MHNRLHHYTFLCLGNTEQFDSADHLRTPPLFQLSGCMYIQKIAAGRMDHNAGDDHQHS